MDGRWWTGSGVDWASKVDAQSDARRNPTQQEARTRPTSAHGIVRLSHSSYVLVQDNEDSQSYQLETVTVLDKSQIRHTILQASSSVTCRRLSQ